MCEWCPMPGTGAYCVVCQDTPEALEPLTPAHLHDVAVGCGFTGDTLAKGIAMIQDEYGVRLSAEQLETFVQGWQVGGIDADNFRKDMAAVPVAPPDGESIPF